MATDHYRDPVRTDRYRTCIKDMVQDCKSRLLCDSLAGTHSTGLLLASQGCSDATLGERLACQGHTKKYSGSNNELDTGVAPTQGCEVGPCHRAGAWSGDKGQNNDGAQPQCNGKTAVLDEVRMQTVAVNLQTLIDGVIGKKFYRPISNSATGSVDGSTDSLTGDQPHGLEQGSGQQQQQSPYTSVVSSVEGARCDDKVTRFSVQQTHVRHVSTAGQMTDQRSTECPRTSVSTVDTSCSDTVRQSVSMSSDDGSADQAVSSSRVAMNLQNLIDGVIGKKYYRWTSDTAAVSVGDNTGSYTVDRSVGDWTLGKEKGCELEHSSGQQQQQQLQQQPQEQHHHHQQQQQQQQPHHLQQQQQGLPQQQQLQHQLQQQLQRHLQHKQYQQHQHQHQLHQQQQQQQQQQHQQHQQQQHQQHMGVMNSLEGMTCHFQRKACRVRHSLSADELMSWHPSVCLQKPPRRPLPPLCLPPPPPLLKLDDASLMYEDSVRTEDETPWCRPDPAPPRAIPVPRLLPIPGYGNMDRVSPLCFMENGTMEREVRQEGAGVINLSTAGGDRLNMKSPLVNGDAHSDTTTTTSQASQQGLQANLHQQKVAALKQQQQQQVAAAAAMAAVAIANTPKRKSSTEAAPPAFMMMTPPSPQQQMQQLLQQQVLSPQHLQQLMQQQTMVLQHQTQQKLQEQALQQLNEQLQVNVMQQGQLLQQQAAAAGGTSSAKAGDVKQVSAQLQQLKLQQQQIVQQIQLQQRQFLLSQGLLGLPQFPPHNLMSPGEMQQLWKEVQTAQAQKHAVTVDDVALAMAVKSSNSLVATTTAAAVATAMTHMPLIHSPTSVNNGVLDGFMLAGTSMLSLSARDSSALKEMSGSTNSLSLDDTARGKVHPLYGHGVCKWPGCEIVCPDIALFFKHLNSEHQLDDRSTAQARVQMQVVSQLELQLSKERERLTAMMQHLHMKPNSMSPRQPAAPVTPTVTSMSPMTTESPIVTPQRLSPPIIPKLALLPPPLSHPSLAPHLSLPMPCFPTIITTPTTAAMALPNSMTLPIVTTPTLPPQTTMAHAVAPSSSPCIRIADSPLTVGPVKQRRVSDKCNLPISAEIQRNREFYKNTDVRPPFTYASLIRQAIVESQEKQLTLNEVYQWFMNTFAFFRKNQATWKNAVRHNLSLHKCFMRVENVKGAVWTVDEMEFYKRRPQKMTSSSSGSGQQPVVSSLYGESLNASLRQAALAESNLPTLNHAGGQMSVFDSPSGVATEAEDLSMNRSMEDRDEDAERDDYPEDLDDYSNSRDEDFQLKAEQHQPLGGSFVLSDYQSNSSDVGEQQQIEKLHVERGEQQLTEQQLIEDQYRQTSAEQQEQQQLLEEPITDELMPQHQEEDKQLREEHQRKTDSNCKDMSDVEMVSAMKVDSSVAMTIMPDGVSLVEKTGNLVTSPCEAASMV